MIFNHKAKGSVIGSGTYVFRHYGNEMPQLSAPLISATDTTVSFEPVENATSYEVYADGVSIGSYTA